MVRLPIAAGRLLLVLALACCTGADETASGAPTSPTAVASGGGGDVMELDRTGEPLPPGRYTSSEFEPRITLELDGSWQAVQAATWG